MRYQVKDRAIVHPVRLSIRVLLRRGVYAKETSQWSLRNKCVREVHELWNKREDCYGST